MAYRNFNGTAAEYRSLHYWVEKQLGKPMKCSKCLAEDKSRYHWANISKSYKREISDWVRLCVKCHLNMDKVPGGPRKEFCVRGHKMEEPNLYIKPSTGTRECRECKKLMHSKAWKRGDK